MRAPAFSPPLLADVLLHEWGDHAFPPHTAACQQAHLGPPPTEPPVLALLALASHLAAELEMDEVSEIVETLQATLGPDVEITFWHGGEAVLPQAAVQLWLLLKYGCI